MNVEAMKEPAMNEEGEDSGPRPLRMTAYRKRWHNSIHYTASPSFLCVRGGFVVTREKEEVGDCK